MVNVSCVTKRQTFDVVVCGAGAAGLMAALFAARGGARVALLEGAKRIGAKILISGGGRCNVTHDVVHARDYNGNRNAIGKVLRSFDVPETVAFFRSLGVVLKREETGKLFPVTDRAASVLDALVGAVHDAGVDVRCGVRVQSIAKDGQSKDGQFVVVPVPPLDLRAKCVILATGGRSVPKTGSDGHGYVIARSLGHSVTPLIPALVPLILEEGHWLTKLSGTSVDAELILRGTNHRERGSLLFTHFGLSGPVVLDMSRHWIALGGQAGAPVLHVNLLPGETFESLEAELLAANVHMTVSNFLHRKGLPERLAEAIGGGPIGKLTRDERRRIVRSVVELPLPVTRDRGFDYAEVTAGGVPLSEVDLTTMESRVCEGLYLCGEILDVDGKIGGYNFQWAWASGRLAGIGTIRTCAKRS